jgi:CRP-like cAMP-binding protein
MINFLKAINQITYLNESAARELKEILFTEEHLKGHILVKPNTVSKTAYFVEKGFTRTFYCDNNGKDITDWFSPEGTLACSIVSFVAQKPDRRGIELLEDSTLTAFRYEDIETLCRKFHQIEHLIRILVTQGLISLQKKLDDLHFASAHKRYENLIESMPFILQRAQLGHIVRAD